jgi:RNA polymerase sigma factor (TIGR02999 family)
VRIVKEDTTQLLMNASQGDRSAMEALLPLVYEELREIAARKMRDERSDHTLQPTALVNEAFLRLVDQTRVQWQGRTHFCAVAANMMRRILVDHARRHRAAKRGAGAAKLALDDVPGISSGQDPVDIVALDELMERLSQLNERHARVVELRFFTGLDVKETAAALGVSPATVKNDWRAARAWLSSQLRNSD